MVRACKRAHAFALDAAAYGACGRLQPRRQNSLLLDLVESSTELFEGIVLRHLDVVELHNLGASCRLLWLITRDKALSAITQARIKSCQAWAGLQLPRLGGCMLLHANSLTSRLLCICRAVCRA